MKVTDSVRPTGFCIGGEGHFRSMDYEVEACCRYEAKHKALEMLARDFDRMKEESQTMKNRPAAPKKMPKKPRKPLRPAGERGHEYVEGRNPDRCTYCGLKRLDGKHHE